MFMFVQYLVCLRTTMNVASKMVKNAMEKVRRLNFLDICFAFGIWYLFSRNASPRQRTHSDQKDVYACMSNYRGII